MWARTLLMPPLDTPLARISSVRPALEGAFRRPDNLVEVRGSHRCPSSRVRTIHRAGLRSRRLATRRCRGWAPGLVSVDASLHRHLTAMTYNRMVVRNASPPQLRRDVRCAG